MTIFWICSVVTLAAGAFAAFTTDLRRSVLSLWIAGLGAGGVYLSLHAEFLAIAQWIISTLAAISFLFYSVQFGEYGGTFPQSLRQRARALALPVLAGAAFCWTIWSAGSALPQATEGGRRALQDVDTLGALLSYEHLPALEVLAILLFLVIIGSGVLARPQESGENHDRAEGV